MRRILFSLAMLVFALAVMEVFARIGGGFIGAGVFYTPQPRGGFDEYMAKRDPVLGWPSPSSFGTPHFDISGSRVVPAYPEPGAACASIYGDSFAYAHGVEDEEAWGNELSVLVGCRVANYGVGGYGSDQALLRFEGNRHDEAPVVVLTHLSENILRNVNQLRRTLYAGNEFGLKPRFVLDGGGELALVPIPAPSADAFWAMNEFPERHLEHDYFVPGGPSGKSRLTFPYTLSVLRSARHFHFRAKLRRVPWYTEFYDPAHPSGGLEVTARVLERFHRTARERDKRSLAVILPTGLDVAMFNDTGTWVYKPLLDRLDELGVEIADLGPPLVEALADRSPCEIFRRCDGHLNPEGNRMLAERLAAQLAERGLLD